MHANRIWPDFPVEYCCVPDGYVKDVLVDLYGPAKYKQLFKISRFDSRFYLDSSILMSEKVWELISTETINGYFPYDLPFFRKGYDTRSRKSHTRTYRAFSFIQNNNYTKAEYLIRNSLIIRQPGGIELVKECEEYKEWIEEEVLEPIRKKKKDAKETCKRQKCKWTWSCWCCNKWKCWIETFFYWITEWVVWIFGKWFVYILCRVMTFLATLVYTAVVYGLGLFRVVGWLSCVAFGSKNVDELSMKQLSIEVVIIDSETETNSITNQEIDKYIADADRIFHEQARIRVIRRGEIRREISSSLYRIDASSFGARVSEWLKGLGLLTGRGHPLYLTVYAVGSIEGSLGLHLPLYGSVFIKKGVPGTTPAHEIGHSLLAIWNTYDIKDNKKMDYLMYTPARDREIACNWPHAVPKISHSERCAMRKSRWLDKDWKDWVKIAIGWMVIGGGGYLLYGALL